MLVTRPAARRATRYHVELACELIDRHHDTPRLMWATDLSAAGIWLQSDADFAPGERLVVSFRPAVAWRGSELTLFAEVARASAGRRWADTSAGMGLRFVDLDNVGRQLLDHWLRPRRVSGSRYAHKLSRRAGRGRFTQSTHPFASRDC